MISIKNLSKSYKKYTIPFNTLKSFLLHQKEYKKQAANIGLFNAVSHLNLEILQSEIFGITGPNGAGKSTLAKLIAGTIEPTHGSIISNGKIVPFLELGVAFNNELTGLDNLYLNGVLLGLSLKYLKNNKEKIFEFADIKDFMNTPLKYYSSGMQLKLAFSIAMHAKGDIYIFDEILAVGDSTFQKKCFDAFDNLLKEKKTIIIISHDIDFIKRHATRLLVLTSGKHYLINDLKPIENINDISSLLAHCASRE